MPVTTGDILEYLSTATGSSGGAITGSTVTSGVPNNVNPDITDAERVAGVTKYRKTFWKNNNGVDSMLKPIVYVPTLPTNATLSIGLGINSSDDDNSAQGSLTAWSANAKVALISDGTDTRVATIVGLDNTGSPVPIIENVVLTSASEVLSVATFSKVYAVYLASTSGSRTVTIRQGASGTTRGTIPPNEIICWLWLASPSSTGAGLNLPDLAPGQNYGVWRRMVVSAGAGAVRPDTQTMRIKEA